jgi:vancomycin resistance protein YoaR
LCQVSTTLFRSVLAAGLRVTERQNHSYRVSYYEPPVGLDATIYLPKPDFKFFNDTGRHILVQGQVIGNRVIFELWGTKDGRTSTVSDPIVTNILPPPPEVRVETDTLFRGEIKQTEKPHEGATAVAYYTVMKDGKVLHKQTFKSVYKPWAAKFLVGTKEPPAPPPAP